MKISHVQQQCNSSCGIACAAMVAGISFEDCLAVAKNIGVFVTEGFGLDHHQLDKILTALNVKWERLIYPDLVPGKVFIAVVPSLHTVGGNHWVVFDYTDCFNVLDPQQGRRGKFFYENEHIKGYGSLIMCGVGAWEEWMKG